MRLIIQKITNFVKKKYQLVGKKRLFLNIIIAFFIVLILVLIDQLTKNLIFSWEDYEISSKKGFIKNISWGFIGFRPLLHQGVTSQINKIVGFTVIHIFAFLLSVILLFLIPFSKKISLTIFMAILLAGNWGNEIDRILNNNTVKDLLFLPFYSSSGTFNFADIFIFAGPIGIILVHAVDIFKNLNWKKIKNTKKHNSGNDKNNF
ncbi:signal peptidase II [Mycoplasma flocculare]|uniref:Lipoprotein signal peptidase n=1 Tax=Mesomycoplasma flocculare ATCC 27399 TaxID=743971 RepID=A0A0A8EBV0_MESFC|nr:signal peptidase II [Mesomycoplasma flocculare]AJC49606.1 lipoprotein signal peptidase [Mesomycoplasma flocculare ATCC 27399]ENX50819.1 lipoprotein signal peptidase [Mesomycoplasma flocculare ATCC 27716]MXR13727.1 signal peptidase II [Mesomycoplasma flocculare]